MRIQMLICIVVQTLCSLHEQLYRTLCLFLCLSFSCKSVGQTFDTIILIWTIYILNKCVVSAQDTSIRKFKVFEKKSQISGNLLHKTELYSVNTT